MARELKLEVSQEGAEQTEQALGKVESRLQGVEQSAEKAGTAIDKEAAALKRSTGEVNDSATAHGKLDTALKGVAQRASALGTGGLVASVGGALAIAAKQALDFAGSTEKAAKAANVSTDAQQRLAFVAGKNRMTFDALAGSMFNLDAKLAKGGDRIMETVEGLGLSINDLMRLSPDERFREIGVAIAGVEDPARQSEAALALFGGTGRDLLGVFDDLAKGADRDAPIMSSAWVDASAEISEALDDMLAKGLAYGKNLAMWALTWPAYTASIAQGWGQAAVQALGFSAVSGVPPRVQGGNTESAEAGARFLAHLRGGDPLDPLQGNSMGFWERVLTQGANEAIHANTPKNAKVLPFVRPELMGESAWQISQIHQAQMLNGIGLFGTGMPGGLSFPGWAPLAAQQNLNFAPFAGSVGMNPANVSTPWWQGKAGRLTGIGAGMLTGLIPGMSGVGSSVGGGLGGAIGSIGSMAGSTLGAFLGPIGGIVGGLVGKLFGPSEGVKTNRTRDAAIEEQFGSVQNLREAAERAGFSVDRLLSTKKVKDFESEFKKLNRAIQEQEADAQRVEEAMQRWGISIDEMGPKFKQSKINDVFKEALDDIRVLTNAGADFNVVAEKMAPQLGAMVHEAIEMGGTVPREMEPILKKMIELGLLTDKNGEKFTSLSEIPFAADLNKDFSTLIGKMDALISRLSQLPGLFGDAASEAGNLADAMPDGGGLPGAGSGGGDEAAMSMSSGLSTGLSVSIGSLVVGTSGSRVQREREIGRAVLREVERRGKRVA